MNVTQNQQLVKFMIASVFILVLVILVVVFSHEKEKPHNPEEFAATAFNRMFSVQEWQPGMGVKQPIVYHPAGLNRLTWQPLPAQGLNLQSGGCVQVNGSGSPQSIYVMTPQVSQAFQVIQP